METRGLSKKETEILLLILKDFSTEYNANNITKKIEITAAGALKALGNLGKKKLVTSKRLGKAIFYKANMGDYYAFRMAETLLINETRNNASRWVFEFKDLFKNIEIAIIFGSIIKNPEKAKDIDLLIVLKKERNNIVNKLIKERGELSKKSIHLIKQTPTDLKKNLRKKDKVIINIIRNGYVLHGYEKLLGLLKNVTSI